MAAQSLGANESVFGAMSSRRGRMWAASFCFWTALGLLYTSQLYVGTVLEGMHHSFWRLLVWQLGGCWYVWFVATPVILWLGRRFPFERAAWRASLAVHVVASTALSLVHTAWVVLSTIQLRPFDEMQKESAFWDMFEGRWMSQLHLELIVYGMILGFGYALDYYRRFREREFRASQLEAQLAQAQLQALKMQLQPHFLFNTLNGIAGLVRDNRNKAAVRMIAGLSDLLRHTLENSGRQEVALRDELEFLELYLDIQQMRFSDRLNVRMEIAPETLDARVPNLILQPLVENAIRHGISPRASSGTVGVSARRDEDFLELRVYDDGPGLRPEGATRGAGIGLTNTRARLEQLYGDNYRFDVQDRTGGGVEATLLLPLGTRRAEAGGDG